MLHLALSLVLALASFQEPLMWTGKASADVVPSQPTEKDAPKLAAEMRRHLEETKAQAEVKRDFAKQLATLDQMRAVANWSFAYPDKAKLLSEIAELRADWLKKLGRHAEAVFAAQHPLVMPEEEKRSPYDAFVWAPSEGSLAKLLEEIDALPKMIELRKRFRAGTPAASSVDAIENVVWDAIEAGDPMTLKEFGTRCVPALQKIMLGRKDEENRLQPSQDPMTILLELDRRSGQAFFLSTLGTRGPVWTLRVIRALNAAGVTQSPWIWSADHTVPPRFDDPQTLLVIDALAAQPMTSAQYFQLLQPLVKRDTVTPAIQAYLLGQVQTTDPVLLTILRGMLDGNSVGPNKRALYEAFLDSPDPELRQRCAGALAFYPVGPATLKAALHSDPNVRSNALEALVRHRIRQFDYVANNTPPSGPQQWIEVPRTPEIQAALLKLARDPESSVRAGLVRALQGAKEEPPADVLEILLKDPEPVTRQAAVYDWSFSPELQARVLERLAPDKDVQVLRTIGYALNMRASPERQNLSLSESKLYLPALATWLANPGTNVSFDPNAGPIGPIRGALLSPEGARMIFDVCIRGPHKEALAPVLLDAVEWERNRETGAWALGALEGPQIAELFVAGCTLWKNQGMIERADSTLYGFVARGELDPKPFAELARDESLARTTRLRTLHIAVPKADEALAQTLFDLLRSATPAELDAESPACRDFVIQLNSVLRFWPGLELVRAKACQDPKIPDALALYLAGNGSQAGALDAATTKACLQRWARLDAGWRRRDCSLFYFLDPRVDSGVLELWRAHYRDPQLAESIVGAMGRYPIDESVPLLAECAVAPISNEVRTSAIDALTARLDDLGADALLKAIAVAPHESIRAKCFNGLEQIRKYQDEKQSWQKRKGGDAAREQAIADLLPMLGDKDANIRAAAARSLATLQAAEHLPKLVALLKDKDANVREAAQKALDALNGAGAKKP